MRRRAFFLLISGLFVTMAVIAQQLGATKPVIIELIAPKGKTIKFGSFSDIKGLGIEDVKAWKNRVVVFANTSQEKDLVERLTHYWGDNKIIVFDNPFYNFNRKYCDNKATAKHWDNIILSANLVADLKLQQEYLNYHATQFQKWPEVSKGFCNAKFQQLLVFKSGRQLMLVISIPKGENLDKLNPLTTKNNPRVDDWNNIMKKYQVGIEGTKKGETWVFFKNIDEKKFKD
ncbi:MAG: L-rhamnose mutarotase [Mucilaginibacter sp.]